MSEFINMLGRHGLLAPGVQGQAIGSLCREKRADYTKERWLLNGDVEVRFYRHDQDRSVGRAVVTLDGQVLEDVTEVIA